MKNNATPKDMATAIDQGMADYAESGTPDNGAQFVAIHVKDFLAQHFGVAMLGASSDAEMVALRKLFDRITK